VFLSGWALFSRSAGSHPELPWQSRCQLYPTEKSCISARREGEDCALLRRSGMSLCNAKFFGRSDQKMGASAPLDAVRAPQQLHEEIWRQAPALARRLPKDCLLTRLYCIA